MYFCGVQPWIAQPAIRQNILYHEEKTTTIIVVVHCRIPDVFTVNQPGNTLDDDNGSCHVPGQRGDTLLGDLWWGVGFRTNTLLLHPIVGNRLHCWDHAAFRHPFAPGCLQSKGVCIVLYWTPKRWRLCHRLRLHRQCYGKLHLHDSWKPCHL